MSDDLRKIREGALQPDRDPPAQPPGPLGTEPLNPITGLPFSPAPLTDPSEKADKG